MAYIDGKEVLFSPIINISENPDAPTSGCTREEVEEMLSGLKYKEILTVNEENANGYIAITTNTPSILEVAIIRNAWGEYDSAYLQLQCNGNLSSHCSLVSIGARKVYTAHTETDWRCIWYIPFRIYEKITVNVKDVFDDNANEVTAEWVSSINLDEVEEIQSYYASKADLGKIDTALDNIIAIQNTLIGGDA